MPCIACFSNCVMSQRHTCEGRPLCAATWPSCSLCPPRIVPRLIARSCGLNTSSPRPPGAMEVTNTGARAGKLQTGGTQGRLTTFLAPRAQQRRTGAGIQGTTNRRRRHSPPPLTTATHHPHPSPSHSERRRPGAGGRGVPPLRCRRQRPAGPRRAAGGAARPGWVACSRHRLPP